MKFTKILKYDLKAGPSGCKMKLLAPLLLAVCAFADFVYRISQYCEAGILQKSEVSAADFFFYIYGGMQQDAFLLSGEGFPFPAIWMAMLLLCAYSVLPAPHRNMRGMEAQLLVRSGGRKRRWLSACVLGMAFTLLFHLLVQLAGLCLCAVWGFEMTNTVHPQVIWILFQLETEPPAQMTLPFAAYAAPVLVSAAVNALQMMLSLFVKPVLAFGAAAVLLALSAYWMNGALIGNYAMLLRHAYVLENGVDPSAGVSLSLALTAACAAVGCMRFAHYDLWNGEEEL